MCSSRQEAPHEIRLGERQDTPNAIGLCAVLRGNRGELSTGYNGAARVLRSQMLRRSPQSAHPRAGIGYRGARSFEIPMYMMDAKNFGGGVSSRGAARPPAGDLPRDHWFLRQHALHDLVTKNECMRPWRPRRGRSQTRIIHWHPAVHGQLFARRR